MDRLASMELFVAIAAEGSLSGAARRTGRSLATVVRGLARLEERLGVRLLERTTRRTRLTEAGADYLERAQTILGQLDEAEALAARSGLEVSGSLVVSAPVTFGRLEVAPVLLELLEAHPGLRVELRLDDAVVGLLEARVDAAVRIGHLPSSGLGASRVGQTRRVVCAAPSYLSARGVPQTVEDLAAHRCLGFIQGGAVVRWSFAPEHPIYRPGPDAPLSSDSVDVLVAGAIAGRGLVQLLEYQVATALTAGQLVEVLEDAAEAPLPIHVVAPHPRLTGPRVSALRDALARRLRSASCAD